MFDKRFLNSLPRFKGECYCLRVKRIVLIAIQFLIKSYLYLIHGYFPIKIVLLLDFLLFIIFLIRTILNFILFILINFQSILKFRLLNMYYFRYFRRLN